MRREQHQCRSQDKKREKEQPSRIELRGAKEHREEEKTGEKNNQKLMMRVMLNKQSPQKGSRARKAMIQKKGKIVILMHLILGEQNKLKQENCPKMKCCLQT
ncbi:hypothetical protein ROHU_003247 [Labeo rohita]|uniref:Uncharacterized protein n=1 Tax=Labeo rohita TaxID=84645 RepID=A0A498LZ96_LABRO|nr:hypothetical protein ROHU_010230 [Labeo rohita]RXN36114.1 hypothetical protein ROHU_003247 [Labeo rohita]